MSQKLRNKIEASNTSISRLLKDQKFFIDYFQREYRWQQKHIKQLIEDLTSTFLRSYKKGDKRADVANYQNYYLGPVVFSENTENGKKSIIDGQQRITSITLLLIYLNNQQKNSQQKVSITEMIFSEKFGEKSFNMSDELREPCLKALFEEGHYSILDNDDETVQNMVDRYSDIEPSFPEEIDETILPFFIDWFIENVVIVGITAYSEENAYTIFETMNDRGLNLSPTEMLKGFVLSKINDKKQRNEINDLWKTEIQRLHDYDENADQDFFQAWFRAKYAVTMRPGGVGSENQDFELIGSRFHSWFRDNYEKLLLLSTSDDFYLFFKNQFPFYVKWYLNTWDASIDYDPRMPHVNYINFWGIAGSLQDPLLLSAVNYQDSEEIIRKKIDYVARYIETFTVTRSINYKKFGQTTIRYFMFNLIKQLRDNSLNDLSLNLRNEVLSLANSWKGICGFQLHGMNGKFIKHLLSRISNYIDSIAGKDTTYVTYHHPNGKQFEIEHLWANKFNEHRDEFEQENEFKDWRNSIGALVLLPQGTNQSFNSDKYEDKLRHYLKENTYAQTLHPIFYSKNPNFINSDLANSLQFQPHQIFKKEDISKRQYLVQRICESLWSTDYFSSAAI